MPPEAISSRSSARVARAGQQPVDEAVFRDAMRFVPMPVAVITTTHGSIPHGTTVSAFGSLSLQPPMIYAALDIRSDLLKLLRRTRRFGVNVLNATQGEFALGFARKGADKFEFVDGICRTAYHGCPRLQPGSPARSIACSEVATTSSLSGRSSASNRRMRRHSSTTTEPSEPTRTVPWL